MQAEGFQFLRPYLWKEVKCAHKTGRRFYARFYSATAAAVQAETETLIYQDEYETHDFSRGPQRVAPVDYPRISRDLRSMTCGAFRRRYASLKPEESRESEVVTIRGRVHSMRTAGPKLVFLDVVQDGQRVQGLCNLRRMQSCGVGTEDLKRLHTFNRGDIISFTGIPHRTTRGELSVNVTEFPIVLSPSLQPLPTQLLDQQTRIRNRHEDLLVNKQAADTLRLRSYITQYLRDFLLNDGFLEVQTPVMASYASGAHARSFKTVATEFPDKNIELRIAPELWLKRLILGGMDRVFEIGSCFRNEGIDLTHNPEFTTCEFYKSFADVETLIAMTEEILSGLAERVQDLRRDRFDSLPPPEFSFSRPFRRVDFIPAIESQIGRQIPDLSGPHATMALIQLFQDLRLPLPTSPTLPRLLDKLSVTYLEPNCSSPTLVMNHPECLAPLSKSFIHPITQHRVSARFELFVNSQELVNAYEEENSPAEQRRKFMEQLRYRDHENEAAVDENYLKALEWGLPPTGGWGCGLDRLVMLFSGAKRIGDVLSFGTLRNVVGLGDEVVTKHRGDA